MSRSISKAKEDKDMSIMKAATMTDLVGRASDDGSYPKLFADGGAGAAYVTGLMKGATQKCNIRAMNEEQVKQGIFDYFDTCERAMQPPTIGGLALWFSATDSTIFAWTRRDDPRGELFALAVQACQQFAEIKAMDGSLNPILYIYQNKAYHGHIETQRIEIVEGANTLSTEEIDAVIDMLPDEDGVYRATSPQ